MSSRVSGPSFAVEVARRFDRQYAFESQPTQVANTCVPAATILYDRPVLSANANGAQVADKRYEFMIEKEVVLSGPNGELWQHYHTHFRGNLIAQSLGTDPGPTAYAGFSLMSPAVDPPWTGGALNTFIQLRKRLHDLTTWELCTSLGDGATPVKTTVATIAQAAVGAGHRIDIFYDPFARFVSAFVDHKLVARHSGVDFPNVVAGAGTTVAVAGFLSTGAGGAACNLKADWFGAQLTSFGISGPGAPL